MKSRAHTDDLFIYLANEQALKSNASVATVLPAHIVLDQLQQQLNY